MRATPETRLLEYEFARKSPRKLAGSTENYNVLIWERPQTAAGECAIGPVEAPFSVGSARMNSRKGVWNV